jgi:uracil-DNA glycosylase
VRARIYLAAVVRCFPGKTPAGGDRVPSAEEIAACRGFIEREVTALRPRLVVPVGRLAIAEVLGHEEPIAEVVGRTVRAHYHGVDVDVICLPHPSGASTWFKLEPGKTLLERALRLLARHPEIRRAFPRPRRTARGAGSQR